MKKTGLVLAVLLAVLLISLGAQAETRTRQEAVSWANARLAEGWNQDYDGMNGCQDTDLIKYYFDYLGVYRVNGYAYSYLNAILPTGWTRSSVPQAGDIAVWGAERERRGEVRPRGHSHICERLEHYLRRHRRRSDSVHPAFREPL